MTMKTNLIKMEVYFDPETDSFMAVDPETGECRDLTVSKKKSATKKKESAVSEDTTARLILETNKYTITTGAAELLGVSPDDRIEIKYEKQGNVFVPIIGSNTTFGTKAGNKLSKSLTVSCRGKANEELSQYGDQFTFEPHPSKSGLFILVGNKPCPSAVPEVKSEVVEIDDEDEEEVDEALVDLLDESSKEDEKTEVFNFELTI